MVSSMFEAIPSGAAAFGASRAALLPGSLAACRTLFSAAVLPDSQPLSGAPLSGRCQLAALAAELQRHIPGMKPRFAPPSQP